MKKLFAFSFSGLLLIACQPKGTKSQTDATAVKENSAKVNAYLDRKFDEYVDRNPESAASLGLHTHYGEWNDRSAEHEQQELAIYKSALDTLKKNFDLNALDVQTRLSVRLYEEEVNRAEQSYKWRLHGYWMTQIGGEHTEIPAFLINVHKVNDRADAEAYISRLSKMDRMIDQVIAQLKAREDAGVVPPHFTFRYVINDIQSFLTGFQKTDDGNVLLKDFKEKVSKIKIDDTDKNRLIVEAQQAIKAHVQPAYNRLLAYWTTLDSKQTKNEGVWSLPNGDSFYAHCLRMTTTTTLTPDQIFETGQKEVARIQQEMHTIMKLVGYKNDSLAAFFEFMRTDAQFRYANNDSGRQELLAQSNHYLNTLKTDYLPKLFNHQPKAPLVVMAVEKFRERSVGGAFYEDPAEDGSRPGRFYVNLYNMNDEPKYQMEALCYHEGIPGHHMQIALAQELQGVPKFRRHGGNTAYIEGWALYSERIPKEIGLYQDPYSDFGRLSMELFRAARLVVDVGIHARHWTKEEATDYFILNTANSKGDCAREIERYFLWPGQATGYKIGMLKILELREKAKQELGTAFDIRGFHDVVLMNGSVPLTVLEELVNQWIKEKQKTI